jgi:amino-acid N-acetyltransferase
MIRLRRAGAEDARAIRRMILAARLDPTALKWQNFLLAVDDANGGALVGCAQIKRHADCNEFGSLTVLPGHRERGIGGQLLRALVDVEAGPVWLVCVRRMEPYYQRFGFARMPFRALPRTLKVKQFFGRLFGIGVVVMVKITPPTVSS